MISVDEIMLAERNDDVLGQFDAVFSNVVGFFKFLIYLICADAIDNQEVAVTKENFTEGVQQNTTTIEESTNE